MFDREGPTGFENGQEAIDICADVAMRILERVAYTGLGSKMDDKARLMAGKDGVDAVTISNVALGERKERTYGQTGKASAFQSHIVVVVDVVASDHTTRSEEHTSELQSLRHLVCRLLLEK